MTKKKFRIVAAICGLCIISIPATVLFFSRNSDGRTSSKLLVPPGPEAKSHVPANLQKAVSDGLKTLNSEDFDQALCGGKGSGLERCVGDYIMVAVDKDAKQTLVRVYQGKKSDPPDYTVALEPGWSSSRVGINVPFTITHPPDKTVVALLTAVRVDGEVREMAYAPYSSSLDTPEMRAAGLRYLDSLYGQAAERLDKRGVKSLYLPAPATRSSDKAHIATLILTEQVFSDTAFVSGDDKERLRMVNRTLVLLAANGPGAYPLSRSRVGAVGIAQIMPTTYSSLAAAYPKADLPRDSSQGRTEHEPAIRTMILHTDNQWWALQKNQAYVSWLLEHDTERSFVFAAGYNASMATVRDAVYTCKAKWLDESCRDLPGETRRYVTKYRWIRELLTNSSFRRNAEKNAGY
ncbi:lytic transglycosylase domain-containing protein [Candidatus Uhrbacteria bacterium]|nr:lytic transglycosylase domain-containing protein [Candidatus Uhrbacteria bacterium]